MKGVGIGMVCSSSGQCYCHRPEWSTPYNDFCPCDYPFFIDAFGCDEMECIYWRSDEV